MLASPLLAALTAALLAPVVAAPTGALASPAHVGSAVVLPTAAAVPTWTSVDDRVAAVTWSTDWSPGSSPAAYLGGDHYTAAAGATAALTFHGTQIQLFGAKAPWHGRLRVALDGGPATTLDAWSAVRVEHARLWSSPPVAAGPHRLTVTATGTARAGSGGSVVAVDRFAVANAPVAVPPAAAGLVTRCGAQLCLDGAPYRFTGANAYELATLWGSNTGCGSQVDDLAGFFGQFRPHSMVRVSAAQQQAFNPTTGRLDWTGLDRVVAAAKAADQKLILTLANNWAGCDDGARKDQAWYDGGYRAARNARGVAPLPFLDYLQQVVTRYQDSPALGMWELVNEPDAPTCSTGFTGDACTGTWACPTTAGQSLRTFFDVVGGALKMIDTRHPLASGVIGDPYQCGTTGDAYRLIHASPAIDVATFHDYQSDTVPLPSGPDSLATRLAQAAELGKPLIVEEAGIQGSASGTDCLDLPTRSRLFDAKIRALLAAGGNGYLVWNAEPVTGPSCGWDVGPGDPLLDVLRSTLL